MAASERKRLWHQVTGLSFAFNSSSRSLQEPKILADFEELEHSHAFCLGPVGLHLPEAASLGSKAICSGLSCLGDKTWWREPEVMAPSCQPESAPLAAVPVSCN